MTYKECVNELIIEKGYSAIAAIEEMRLVSYASRMLANEVVSFLMSDERYWSKTEELIDELLMDYIELNFSVKGNENDDDYV